MSYVETWDETAPDGSVVHISALDDWQRQAKRAVRERLEGDAAAPLTGVYDSFSSGTIKMGSGRIHAVATASLGGLTLQDGRMAIATDTNKLYHLAAGGLVEIAYSSNVSPTFTGTVTAAALTVTGALVGVGATFSSTVQVSANQVGFKALATTVDTRLFSDSTNGFGVIGMVSAHPLVMLYNSTEVSRWDSTGQGLTGNLIASGNITGVTYNAAASGGYLFSGRGGLSGVGDGVFQFLDTAGASFSRLSLGPASASFPALKRNGTAVEIRLGDDSDRADLLVGVGTFTSINVAGGFLSSSPTGGIGYGTGAGSAVVQGGAVKTQGVTLNAITGQITTNAAQVALSFTVSFTVANNTVHTNDTVLVNHISGGTLGAYQVTVSNIVNGTSFQIDLRNITAGNLSETLVFQFAIIRGVAA